MPGGDDDHPGPAQQVEPAEDPVQAGDADVDDQLGARGRGSAAVSRASRATGRSEVPAASTTTRPPVAGGTCGGQASSRASASQVGVGQGGEDRGRVRGVRRG